MRTAQIGDDGRIYDADGNVYGATRPRREKQLGQYPQMKEFSHRGNPRPVEWYPRTYTDSALKTKTSYNPHENKSWYLSGPDPKNAQMLRNYLKNPITLGQLSGPPNIPDACVVPPGGGAGYKIAKTLATPLLNGYTFTREQGDPAKNVYPGRFVVSDAYPDVLFRVAYRAASVPTNVKLLALQGQGAGNYIEVPISPAPNGVPSLLGAFFVVPVSCAWSVENSFVNPLPIFGGGKSNDTAKISLNYVRAALQQAWYMISTLVIDTADPVAYKQSVANATVSVLAGAALALKAVDMAAASYDFEVIGGKELNIVLRVGVSIYQKATELYDFVDPDKSDSLFNISNADKAAAFEAKVDESSTWSAYWASMVTRATLYYGQTSVYRAMAAQGLFNSMSERFADMYGAYSTNPEAGIKALVGKDEPGKGPITAERAAQILAEFQDWTLNKYRTVVSGRKEYEGVILKNVFPDSEDLDDLPTRYFIYDQLLKENAADCADARKVARGEGPACFDGLGAAPTPPPPGGEPTSGPDYAKAEKDIIRTVVMAKINEFRGDPSKPKMTLNNAAIKVADLLETNILRMVEADGLADAAIADQKVKVATEVQRSLEVALNRAKNAKEREAAKQDNVVRPANFMKEHLLKFKGRFGSDLTILRGSKKSQEITESAAKIADTLTEGLSLEAPGADGKLHRSFVLGLMLPGEADKQGIDPAKLVVTPGARAGLSTRLFIGFVEAISKMGLFKLPGLTGDDAMVKKVEWEATLLKNLAKNFGMDDPATLDKALQIEQAYALDSLHVRPNTEGDAEKVATAKSPDQKNPDGKPYNPNEKYTLSVAMVKKYELRHQVISLIRQQLGVAASGGTPMTDIAELYDKTVRQMEAIQGAVTVTREMEDNITKMIAIADGVIKTAQNFKDGYEDTKSAKNKEARDEFKKDEDNPIQARRLFNVLSSAVAVRNVLNKVLEGGGKGPVDPEAVKANMKELTTAVGDLQIMNELVIPRWENYGTWTTLWMTIKKVLTWMDTKISGSSWYPIAQKSILMRIMITLVNYPLYWSFLLLPFFAIAVPFVGWQAFEYMPAVIVWQIVVFLKDLVRSFLPSSGVGDYELPGSEGKGFGKIDPFWKFIALSLGISAIFFGDKLFPAVGAMFGTLSRGIDSLTKIIVPKKGAGQRGRPAGEQKYAGRGAPIKVDEVAIKLKEARDQGNAKEEGRLIDKLKRAEDRGQKIPAGLVGWILR